MAYVLHEHDGSGCYDCESCMASSLNSLPCKCPPDVKTFDMEHRRMSLTTHQIDHMFGHTAASIEGPNPREEIHARIRKDFKDLASTLDSLVPDSVEKTQAFVELQTAAMWFHKGLATTP